MNRRNILKMLGMVVPAIAFAGLPSNEIIETIAVQEGWNSADLEALNIELSKIDISGLFENDNAFYAAISKGPVAVVSKRDMRVPLQLHPGGKQGWFDPQGGTMGRGEPS